MKSTLSWLLVLITSSVVIAQDGKAPYEYSPALEQLLESSSNENPDKSATLDELEAMRVRPIDVNKASAADLEKILFFPPLVARKIIALRDSLRVLTFRDLQTIKDLDDETLSIISQFLQFGKAEMTDELERTSTLFLRTRTTTAMQQQKAYREKKYFGNGAHEYGRLMLANGPFSAGMVYDVDSGERLEDGFASAHIGYEGSGLARRLIVGNFSLNAGEGLTLSTFRSSSKGGDALHQIKAFGRTIVPHLSADEFHYFRGAAATVEFFPFELSVFFSKKPIDATVEPGGADAVLYTSGLFRSQNELAKRGLACETAVGGIATLNLTSAQRIGLTFLRVHYDRDIEIPSSLRSRRNEILVFGVHANFLFESFSLFGEAAGNRHSLEARAAGVLCRISNRLSVASHVRSYSAAYGNPYAFGFGEQNGMTGGERGAYIGLEYRPTTKVRISSYYDEFKIPAVKGFEATGHEYVVRYEHTLSRKLRVNVQHKGKSKNQEMTISDPGVNLRKIYAFRDQQNLRFSMTYAAAARVDVCQRVELVRVGSTTTEDRGRGTILFTELSWSAASGKIRGTARFTFFDTDSYNARLYEYERDVRGGYTSPLVYGRGIRWYVVAAWQPWSSVEASFKYGETLFPGSATTGSGDSEIAGPLDNRVTFQLDIVL